MEKNEPEGFIQAGAYPIDAGRSVQLFRQSVQSLTIGRIFEIQDGLCISSMRNHQALSRLAHIFLMYLLKNQEVDIRQIVIVLQLSASPSIFHKLAFDSILIRIYFNTDRSFKGPSN